MADLPLKLVAAGASDVGRQRDHNEDSLALVVDCALFVVADGMGGHQAGDVASRLATSLIADFFQSTESEDSTWPSNFDRNLSDEENRLLTGIYIANRRIFEQSRERRECHGMGTTVVTAHYSERRKRMYFGHVGDSRAYRIRAGRIEQLTRDHSLQNEPHLSDRDHADLPKNVITRALGMDDTVNVDLCHDDVRVWDIYLLCSDGLSGMVTDDRICEIVMSTSDPTDACHKLIAAANQRGGEDNITALVVRVEPRDALEEATTEDVPPDSLTPVA